MEGENFITINPATLDDETMWSYRDIQRLAKKAGINAKQKRTSLVEALLVWHRDRTDDGKALVMDDCIEDDLIEMNVCGNNFALLSIDVQAGFSSSRSQSPIPTSSTRLNATVLCSSNNERKKSSSRMTNNDMEDENNENNCAEGNCKKTKRRTSLIKPAAHNDVVVVSPNLLKPLAKPGAEEVTTPQRSILKVTHILSDSGSKSGNTNSNTKLNRSGRKEAYPPRSASKQERDSGTPMSKASRLCFSPFNSVLMISHRTNLQENCQESYFNDYSDY